MSEQPLLRAVPGQPLGVRAGRRPELAPCGVSGQAAVQEEFGSCWSVWYSDRWHASSKPVFCWGYVAETEDDLREQLDSVMAAAVPELRARLAAAEAAAGRLRERPR
jgi:hypothetical protein